MEKEEIEKIVWDMCDILTEEQFKIWDTDKFDAEKTGADKALHFAKHVIQRGFGII